MSDLRVTNLKGRTAGSSPTLPDGVVITGVATATSFSGNLTGTATGLSGSPIISVSGVNNSGVSTLTDLRLASIADKTTIVSGNSVSLVYNTGGGNIAICTNPSGPITLNVTGIPTGVEFDNHTLTFSIVAIQTATGYACTSVTLNGTSVTLRHSGGSVAAGNTSCTDVFNFVGLNTVGSASTTSNYLVLTNLNGEYRA